ncbi:hypothetical protein [Streptomyces radicis]|uniref:hypothetical protein n=1 Tax=Streptomyces radicis TaxID=1750517 RepID=UPI00160063E9|nr:hypothetical protein [Streptomyces radicis]
MRGPGDGRAPGAQRGAYLLSGTLLLVFAGGVLAWLLNGLDQSGARPIDLIKAFFDPTHPVPERLLAPYEWVFTVALVAVGLLALAQRRFARGGALLLAFVLLALCLRQGVGALDATYREGFDDPDYGAWTALTYVGGFVIAVAIVVSLLRAREERRSSVTAPLGGAVLLVLAAIHIAWVIDRQRILADVNAFSWGDYARDLVDPSLLHAPLSLSGGVYFHEAALLVAAVVVGALAVANRPAARGAGVVVLALLTYLEVRAITLRFQLDWWDESFDSTRGVLDLLTHVVSIPLAVAGFALLLWPTRERGPGLGH